ncbi:hypothetical protein PGT21_016760 [Puccinia graminis f. sp. tritici]|uniref:Uncharacterized protein n=1 Tax=Puccinia graminis f. sp. tritici TaxID=56615 RepID=A0A5B0LKS2_PUCGR|nr:hypothetical protein PGT21_016760 [Puccinia graminis f. sp. tritici]
MAWLADFLEQSLTLSNSSPLNPQSALLVNGVRAVLGTHRNPQEPSRTPGTPLIVGTCCIVGLGVRLLETDPQDASDPRNTLGSLGTDPRPSILFWCKTQKWL